MYVCFILAVHSRDRKLWIHHERLDIPLAGGERRRGKNYCALL